jgi:hypothetical protein
MVEGAKIRDPKSSLSFNEQLLKTAISAIGPIINVYTRNVTRIPCAQPSCCRYMNQRSIRHEPYETYLYISVSSVSRMNICTSLIVIAFCLVL